MKIKSIDVGFVEFIPSKLVEGTLYVSMTYATTVHLCACGCGNKVALPLSPVEWQMYFNGESISLTPSVGNWEFACRSHYWIRDNKIRPAPPWSEKQIAAGRSRDATDLDRYLAGRPVDGGTVDQAAGRDKGKDGLLRAVRCWLPR